MSKTRIGVLRGGPSREHDVSIDSGGNLLKQIRNNLGGEYTVTDIYIDRDGTWHVGGIPKKPIDAVMGFDVIWNALHGEYCEDGTVQKILDQSSIPYTGSGSFASSQAFNKKMFREAIKALNETEASQPDRLDLSGLHGYGQNREKLKEKFKIKTPLTRYLKISITDDLEALAEELFRSFPIPAVVKPQSGGNSVGVYVVTTQQNLLDVLREAATISNDVMIEEYISGTEIVSGFVDGLRGQDTYILVPVEVATEEKKAASVRSPYWTGHLDTISRSVGKYDISSAAPVFEHHLNSPNSRDHRADIEKIVARVRDLLGMRHYATFDFILSPRRGLYLIEADTHPHLTEHSPLLESLRQAGVNTSDFIKHILGRL